MAVGWNPAPSLDNSTLRTAANSCRLVVCQQGAETHLPGGYGASGGSIESMHMRLRKIVKNRGHFPSDEVASKLLFLALRNIEKDWKMPPIMLKAGANQFAIPFSERFTNALS